MHQWLIWTTCICICDIQTIHFILYILILEGHYRQASKTPSLCRLSCLQTTTSRLKVYDVHKAKPFYEALVSPKSTKQTKIKQAAQNWTAKVYQTVHKDVKT